MSNILITGCAGFIGSHLADKLIDLGHNIVGIDNLSTGNLENINPKTIFIKMDINDPLEEIFDKYKFDYVFHTAAQINLRHSIKNPKEDAKTNIIGSLNLIENCLRTNVKKFIFSSTGGAIYDENAELPWVEDISNTFPKSPYGLSKLTIENYLKISGLPYCILRYSNVFGPRQQSAECGVCAIFIYKILKNQPINIYSDGEQTRDFINVNNVVAANILAIDKNLQGIYNVSSNTSTSVNKILGLIKTAFNVEPEVNYLPEIPGELKHSRLSSEKLQSYGWQSNINLEESIKKTIEYFKNKLT